MVVPVLFGKDEGSEDHVTQAAHLLAVSQHVDRIANVRFGL